MEGIPSRVLFIRRVIKASYSVSQRKSAICRLGIVLFQQRWVFHKYTGRKSSVCPTLLAHNGQAEPPFGGVKRVGFYLYADNDIAHFPGARFALRDSRVS